MATSGVGVRELPEAHNFDFIGSGPGPVRDFGTERALAEPLGPNTGNFPNSSTHFTLLTELNLTVPKARPEAHTFDFITFELAEEDVLVACTLTAFHSAAGLFPLVLKQWC